MAEQNLPTESNPLINRFFLSPTERADKDKGKEIVKSFYKQQTSNDNLSYFKGRNARWIELLLWSKGSQPMKEFLDYISVSDGNKSYVNIDMTQQRIAAQFVGTLVESMSKNTIYPCVNAIDDGSMSQKEERELDALYRMHEVEEINKMQQESGIQLEPSGVYVPDDEISAKVYFQLEDRLPKEIRFEQMLSKVLNDIKFERILNRKSIYDLTVLNLAATKIERLSYNQYTVRKCIPTNMVYNFFINDSGDCEVTMIGEFYNLKVKDYRSKFGKSPSNPNGLTEKEIFDLAKMSNNKNVGTFNFMWNDSWALTTFNQNRPYDDYSILVFDCEVNCGEDMYYVSKTDNYGKEDLQAKKGIPYAPQVKKDGSIIEQPKPDNVEIIKKQRNTWMRGVYAPYGDKMLYWGVPDIIITPYTDVYKPLSSYTIGIPNNDGEYVPSLFERIMEPLREYTLTKLKRKQLIAKIKPSGIRIDVESARNLDLGSGDSIAWEEVVRIYDQTGNELWSSKGVDPLQRESPPLGNTVQDTSIEKVIGLTNILAGIVNEIRQLIGVPQYRDGSDVGDRTSGVLQKQQNMQASNVSDYVLNTNNQVWEETCYKLCLLHWNDIVKQEPESKDDLLNTRFDVSVKMKSTEYEKELLERDIDRYSQVPDALGQPSLTLKDAMFIREIDDAKMARWYLTKTYEENRRRAEEQQQKRAQENIQSQQESAAKATEGEMAVMAKKMEAEKDMLDFKSTKEKEVKVLEVYGQIAAKGLPIPPVIASLMQDLYPNIKIPLQQENQAMMNQLQQPPQPQQGQPQMQEQPTQEQAEPQQEQMQQEQAEQQPQMM